MRVRKCSFFVFLCIIVGSQNKGSYNVTVTHIETCKGPRLKNCSEYHVWVESNYIYLHFDMNMTEDMIPTKGSVNILSTGKPFFKLVTERACQNSVLKPMFHDLFNVTDGCIILEGHYEFVLDIQEILRKYSDSMPKGIYDIKSSIYGSICNFYCSLIKVKVTS